MKVAGGGLPGALGSVTGELISIGWFSHGLFPKPPLMRLLGESHFRAIIVRPRRLGFNI